MKINEQEFPATEIMTGIITAKPCPYMFSLLFLVLSGIFGRTLLFSEVIITPPDLGPGTAQLQALLTEEIDGAAGMLESYIDELAAKPELFMTMGTASTSLAAIITADHSLSSSKTPFFVSVGTNASLFSDIWNPDSLNRRFEDMEPEDDFSMGASVQPLSICLGIGHVPVLPRLGVSLRMSLYSIEYQEFLLKGGGFSLFGTWRLLREKEFNQLISWQGFYAGAGFGYNSMSLTADIQPGVFSQSFDLDPDGDGPLFTNTVSIEHDPTISLGISCNTWQIPLLLKSGITIADMFSLQLGVSPVIGFGETALTMDSSEEIVVLGYLGDIQDSPGTITIDYESAAVAPKLLETVVFTRWSLLIGGTSLSLLGGYGFSSGILGGLEMGVSF